MNRLSRWWRFFWRWHVHRLTGWDMHQHVVMTKAEARIEMVTEPDGRSFKHADLFLFGQHRERTTDMTEAIRWQRESV